MIDFDCPKCDEPLSAKSKSAGKLIVCPECERKIRIPEEPERPRKKKKRKKRSKSNPRGLVMGCCFCGLGGIMLLGAIIAIFERSVIALLPIIVGPALIYGGIQYFREEE